MCEIWTAEGWPVTPPSYLPTYLQVVQKSSANRPTMMRKFRVIADTFASSSFDLSFVTSSAMPAAVLFTLLT